MPLLLLPLLLLLLLPGMAAGLPKYVVVNLSDLERSFDGY
jgi:hypothetical protein